MVPLGLSRRQGFQLLATQRGGVLMLACAHPGGPSGVRGRLVAWSAPPASCGGPAADSLSQGGAQTCMPQHAPQVPGRGQRVRVQQPEVCRALPQHGA